MNAIFETPLYPYTRHADQDAETPVRRKVVIVGLGPLARHGARSGPAGDRGGHPRRQRQGVLRLPRDLFRQAAAGDSRPSRRGQADGRQGRGLEPGQGLFDERKVYDFNLLPEEGHQFPAFINLQQYYFEQFLVDRLREIEAEGAPVELRGGSRVSSVEDKGDHVALTVETPEGPYPLEADWLIACDGAGSPVRSMMGLDFVGRVFEDNFLIADVVMEADFPTERWFWFDPPFNRGSPRYCTSSPTGCGGSTCNWAGTSTRKKRKSPRT